MPARMPQAVPVRRWFGALAFLGLAAATPAAHADASLSFDGTNDYVTMGAAPGLGSASFTLETWFRRSAAGVGTSTGSGGVTAIPLVTKGRSEADGTNQDMNYFLGIRASDGVLVADFEEGAGGAQPGLNHPIAGTTPVSTGVWQHAAVTYDGSRWQLFLNGSLQSELVVGRPPRADSIQRAALGSAQNSTGVASGFFAGSLDEVRIWNHARTAAQIAAGRDVEITSATGLIGRWGLDEGSGTVAADSSGTGANGTLVNGPAWGAGFQQPVVPTVTRGPYLQLGTPTSVILRWRTDSATDSRVRYGTDPANLNLFADDAVSSTEHQVQLGGLAPATRYYYGVGSTTAILASGADYAFTTAPPAGTPQATRIWVLGDSGTADSVAAGVRNGYAAFAAGRVADVWLMLGDNAYQNGTDAEYEAAVFDMYPAQLRQTVLWATIGNHDTAGSTNPPLTIPHFQIFNNPTNGAAGGVPSGTEKYYSFDYGRIHFICLDSMTSSRAPGSAMLNWLLSDLESTTQDWIIAFWHHPPYTKGSHNSDTESQLVEMRANILPILEAGGVDLVLTGHSHNYERSFLIDGHYGLSGTFTQAMKVDGGSGREDGDGSYVKPADLAGNEGAVYVVAGNGGHVTNWVGGSTAEFNPNPHPAMYLSVLHVGSLVLDVDGDRLDAKMIRETGVVDDYFTLVKSSAPNTPPTVAITAPAQGSGYTAPATVAISADAGDADGSVQQVQFFANGNSVGVDSDAPFALAWNNVAAGGYALTATATDNLGASTTSAPVDITISAPPPPAAPTGLVATAGNAQVALAWNASAGATSYSVRRATASGGPYITVASGLAGTSSVDGGLANGTTYHYVVTATGAGGESGNSAEASATPTAPPALPAAPTNLSATGVSKTQINLAWSDNAGNETAYSIERSNSSGNGFAVIATVGANVSSYANTGLKANKTYYYRVRATNAAGASGYSNTATGKTLR